MILQLFAINDDKLSNFAFNYSDQVDEWGKETGDYQLIQQNMDSRAEELRLKHNALIDTIQALTGSLQMGHTSASITAETVAEALEENRLATNTKANSSDVYLKTETYNKTETNTLLSDKADKSNVLEKDNSTPFAPIGEYNPATKKYVDDSTSAGMPLYNPLEFYQVNATGDGTQGSTLPTDNETNIVEQGKEIDLLKTFPTVGGTANAITAATPTDQDFDYTVEGNPITIIPTANNTGASTLNIDNVATKDIRKPDGAGGYTALEGDELQKGVPAPIYRMVSLDFFLFAPKSGAAYKMFAKASGTITTGLSSINIPIPDLNLDTDVLIFSVLAGGGNAIPSTSAVMGILTSTQAEFSLDGSALTNLAVELYILRFANVKPIQRGTALIGNTTINSVTVNNTFVVGSFKSTYSTPGFATARYKISNPTTLNANVNTPVATIAYQIVETK